MCPGFRYRVLSYLHPRANPPLDNIMRVTCMSTLSIFKKVLQKVHQGWKAIESDAYKDTVVGCDGFRVQGLDLGGTHA
jgi:hypothetical protein